MAILVKRKKGINSTAFHSQCKTSVKSGATYGRNGNHPPVPARQRPLTQTGQCDYRARATVSDGKTTAERRAKSSELPRCVAGQTRRAAVAIVWQREKGFRAGTGTGDSTAGFVSSAPSPNDAMPHYFRNYEAVSLKLPQAAQVAPKTPSPTPLKGHGRPAAIKGWSPEHTTSSAVWHVGLLT